jgi:uncharacterized protein (DUF1800 family)
MQTTPPSISAAPSPASAGNTRRKVISDSLSAVKPGEFGFEQARHLLWRAGFGGTPSQVQTLVSWGPEKSVEHIVNYADVAFEDDKPGAFDRDIKRPANDEERGELARARRSGDERALAELRARQQQAERLDREQMNVIQKWWLARMIETPRPLEEKLTLFWHGHFATSFRTIENSYHMYMQNRLFRANAAGNFGSLLFAIIRDPAMIAYLDNNDSRKGRPNENLARELMELFSLGVGNYGEQDIKEGARALTGYTFSDDEFEFQKNNHDEGSKRILGQSGTMDGDDFVKAILAKPACARFICTKLYRFFVADYPTGREEIDKAAKDVIGEMAATLVKSKYELRPVLRRLFMSEHFYQPELLCEQIKSPCELVVGAVRSLNTPVRDLGVLNDAMNMMGQSLFYPPSVKGWDGGRAWINTSTMYVRQNILCFLLTGKMPQGYDPMANTEKYDPSALLSDLQAADSSAARDPEKVVDYVLRFTLGTQAKRSRETLVKFFQGHGGRVTPETMTGALLLVTAMPEYQLC